MATRHNNPLKFKPNTDFRDLSKFDSITDSGIYFINDLYDVIHPSTVEQESKPYIDPIVRYPIDYNSQDNSRKYGGYYDNFKSLTISTKDELFDSVNVPNENNKISDEGKFMLGGDEFDNGDKASLRFDTKGGYPSFLRGHGNGTTSYRGTTLFNNENTGQKRSGHQKWFEQIWNQPDPYNYDRYNINPAHRRGVSIFREVYDPLKKEDNYNDGRFFSSGEDPFALLGVLIVQGTDHFCIQKFINREYVFYRYRRNGKWGNWKHNLPNVTEYVDSYTKADYDNGIRKDFENINYPIGFDSTQNRKGYLFHSKDVYSLFEALYTDTPFTEAEFKKLLDSRIKKSEIDDLVLKSGDTLNELHANILRFSKKNEVYGRNTLAIIGEFTNGQSPRLAEGENLGVKYKIPDGLLNIASYTHHKDPYKREIIVGDPNTNLLFYVPHLSGIMGRSTSARYLTGYDHNRPWKELPGNKYDFFNTVDLGDAMSTISKKWLRHYKSSPNEYIREMSLPGDTYEALVYFKVRKGSGYVVYEKLPHPLHLRFSVTQYTNENGFYFNIDYGVEEKKHFMATLDLHGLIAQGTDNIFRNLEKFSNQEKKAYCWTYAKLDYHPNRMKVEGQVVVVGDYFYPEVSIGYGQFEVFIDSIYVKKLNNGNWR